MIKDLISEISYDKISLSQALNRSKLIAAKINNEDFKQWLRKELEGYDFDDKLPRYRIVDCQMFIKYMSPVGMEYVTPVVVSGDRITEEEYKMINTYRELNTISSLEKVLLDAKGSMSVKLPHEFVSVVAQGSGQNPKRVISGYQEFNKGKISNVIDLTKQKLLDILLELHNEFPNLENEFSKTDENMEKASNIITNNIYGNQNPLNIAAGVNVEQKDIHNTFQVADLSELKKYGVEEKEIDELRGIIKDNSSDKPTFKEKAGKWIGTVCTSLASKQLTENIPTIIDFMHKHVL